MLKGVRCVRGSISMEEHELCMIEQPGPPCGIEPSILQLITRPSLERERDNVVFSPSSISSCHRQSALKTDQDWYIDVKSSYKMVRGTIIHEGMGHEPAYPGVLGAVREKRMSAPINTAYGGQLFKGKPDLVVLNSVVDHVAHVKIVDYKTRSEIGHDLVSADYRYCIQINMYSWLASQFLPEWLNAYDASVDYKEHLFLNDGVSLPYIGSAVVDEISLVYLDMKQTRTFTNKAFLSTHGKMISDKVDGRWIRRKPVEYEELELEPLHLLNANYTRSIIRKGIEDQIVARTVLAPPLTGDDAKLMCRSCPVRQSCYSIGRREGYSMNDQEGYIS